MSIQQLPGKSKRNLWIAAGIIILMLLGNFSDWIVEYLWLNSLEYEQVFWTIKKTQFLLVGLSFVLAMAYLIPNASMLANRLSDLGFTDSPLARLNLDQFSPKAIKSFFYSVGTVLSSFFAFVFYMRWDAYFRFHWSETFGKVDPIFQNDIGFYLFRLPFLEAIQNSLIVLAAAVFVALFFFYLNTGSISFEQEKGFTATDKVKNHLTLNFGIWMLMLSWGYFLERYRLLMDPGGVVFGAGYTDITLKLPLLWVMCGLTLLLAVLAFAQPFFKNLKPLMLSGAATAAVGIVGMVFLPVAVQNFVVQPNELELETPYLKHNIALTRDAYDLNKIKERQYDAGDSLTWDKLADNTSTLKNIRLWDPRLIIQTYRQLQEIRLYYQFYNVDIDRYETEEGYTQMMLSARELSNELPEKADTWVNRHLQYTHGYGLVMSPVAQIGREGDPRLVLKDLPPVSDLNFEVEQAAIYYGEHDPSYKLVNTEVEELDFPKGDQNVYTRYDGKGGVSIDNLFEKLLFAWEFGDLNFLLTDYIREGSKIQFWKNIKERVKRIAPFLMFEDDPYLVLIDGQLKWILDAYTTSADYPYSERYQNRFNYIRNSVKVVVDAYHGSVDFYTVDDKDPVLNVYRDIFPDMFKPFDEMPDGLKKHIRYPQNLMKIQMEIYNEYHMTTPQVFYNNEDLWTRPNEKYGGKQIMMEPYYILSKLPGTDKLQYLLISPLTPNNRDNMIAWMTAKSDIPNYGELEVFKLPKERLILGPAQIEAKIDQDTEISRQLSLWDQRGSKVIRGNLMVIPIEDSFLYVEPVFLIAEGVDIPQLQRVIMTTGAKVVMEPTLDLAIEALFGKRPDEQIMSSAEIEQTRQTIQQQQPGQQVDSDLMREFRSLWKEARQAFENGNFEEFGKKMDEINTMLEE